MPCGYIDDGYTLAGHIAAAPGIYNALEFQYRPLTIAERCRLFEGWPALSAETQIARTTEALARHLFGWNLRDSAGAIVPCDDPAALHRLSPPLHDRLLDIVCGAAASNIADASEDGYEEKHPLGN